MIPATNHRHRHPMFYNFDPLEVHCFFVILMTSHTFWRLPLLGEAETADEISLLSFCNVNLSVAFPEWSLPCSRHPLRARLSRFRRPGPFVSSRPLICLASLIQPALERTCPPHPIQRGRKARDASPIFRKSQEAINHSIDSPCQDRPE